jgi:hypothetical protein
VAVVTINQTTPTSSQHYQKRRNKERDNPMVLFGTISNMPVDPRLSLVSATANTLRPTATSANGIDPSLLSFNNTSEATTLAGFNTTTPGTPNFISQMAELITQALVSKFTGATNATTNAGTALAGSLSLQNDPIGLMTKLLGDVLTRLNGGQSTPGAGMAGFTAPSAGSNMLLGFGAQANPAANPIGMPSALPVAGGVSATMPAVGTVQVNQGGKILNQAPDGSLTGDVLGKGKPGSPAIQAEAQSIIAELKAEPTIVAEEAAGASIVAQRGVSRFESGMVHMIGNSWMTNNGNILDKSGRRGVDGDVPYETAIRNVATRKVAGKGLLVTEENVRREAMRIGDIVLLSVEGTKSDIDQLGQVEASDASGRYATMNVADNPLPVGLDFDSAAGQDFIATRGGFIGANGMPDKGTLNIWRAYWHGTEGVGSVNGEIDPGAAFALTEAGGSLGATNDASALGVTGKDMATFMNQELSRLPTEGKNLVHQSYMGDIIANRFDKTKPIPSRNSIHADVTAIGAQVFNLTPAQMDETTAPVQARKQGLLAKATTWMKEHPQLVTAGLSTAAGAAAAVAAGCPFAGATVAGIGMLMGNKGADKTKEVVT